MKSMENGSPTYKADGQPVGYEYDQLLPTVRWRRAATAVSLLMVIVAVSMVMLLSRGVDKELYYVSTTAELRQQADLLMLNLIEMNSGESAFTATHDYTQFQRFFRASRAIDDIFLTIDGIAVVQDRGEIWLDDVKKSVEKLRRKLTKRILLAQQSVLSNDNVTFSRTVVDATPGHISELISSFINKEEMELANRRAGLDLLRASMTFAAILAVVSTFVLAYVVINRFRRDVRRLRAYQSLLYSENAVLEQRVKERTGELEAARAHAEKERHRVELLLQDSSHRIGNSLATVSSLLGLQLRRSNNEEVRAALNSARDRIQTISSAHRRLRLGDDLETANVGEFLSAVVNDVQTGIAADARERIEITTDFETWYLAARDVTTLGIILGELLTNAVKHAFPDGRHGTIMIKFGKVNDDKLELTVEDNGVGLPKDTPKQAQGLGKLVVQQLCMQFGEKPHFDNRPDGGTRVVIPLPTLGTQKPKKT